MEIETGIIVELIMEIETGIIVELIIKKYYRTESSSSFLSLASLTLILSMDMLIPPCQKLML